MDDICQNQLECVHSLGYEDRERVFAKMIGEPLDDVAPNKDGPKEGFAEVCR